MSEVMELTAAHLRAAIAARYEWPEWHVEPEVTLGGRRLDVVALNLWGARQWRIVGFEIKVSRGDWMRELDAFQKSEEWTEVVDGFYVVTPPKLIKEGELPEGWGLLELTGNRMMTRRHASQRPARATLPREVAARFLTRLGNDVRAKILEADWRREHELEPKIRAELAAKIEREHATTRTEQMRADQADYRKLLMALGLNPVQWEVNKAALRAAAVYADANGDMKNLRRNLDVTIGSMKQHVMRLEGAAEAIDKQAVEAPNG